MANIVITGSSRGIGYALADAFLDQGCTVTISGSNNTSTETALAKLLDKYGDRKVHGHPCDVTEQAQVQALWDSAVERFGRVDIWVNNAGIAHDQMMLWEIPSREISNMISTNLLGTAHGVKVAVKGMLEQEGGKIFNLEGYGSDGKRVMPGMNFYGTTKAAITFFSKSLALELKDTSIIAGTLRPGMVVTDMILDQYEDRPEDFEKFKRVLNLIADLPENVGPVLARRMLACEKNGEMIKYLSTGKMMLRFLTAPFSKRDLFGEN